MYNTRMSTSSSARTDSGVIPTTMSRLPRTVLSRRRADDLAVRLDGLIRMTPTDAVNADPIQFVRRYQRANDIEVAAVFAATLAFGRVAAFQPVIGQVLAQADRRGGPAAWVDNFDATDAAALAETQYRWIRGPDLALLAATLGAVRTQYGSLQEMFMAAIDTDHSDIGPALDTVVGQLRDTAIGLAPNHGLPPSYDHLSRGFRHTLPRPSSGSACKRWNMLLRWMVRRPSHASDPDLGLWPISPRQLIIPLDTHVLRTARLVGLTRRSDGSWRTAVEVTRNLARIDPDDPVRFDFALAHLGISGRCHARHVSEICGSCSLAPVCRFGTESYRVTHSAGA